MNTNTTPSRTAEASLDEGCPGGQPMGPHNPVGWFEIYVKDIARAQRFYEAVLGITMSALEQPAEHAQAGVPPMKMVAFPMLMGVPGATGSLVQMEGYTPSGGGVCVYFICDDCATEANRVTQAGGTLMREKMSIGQYGFCALAQDPEGNMFGLHSMR